MFIDLEDRGNNHTAELAPYPHLPGLGIFRGEHLQCGLDRIRLVHIAAGSFFSNPVVCQRDGAIFLLYLWNILHPGILSLLPVQRIS